MYTIIYLRIKELQQKYELAEEQSKRAEMLWIEKYDSQIGKCAQLEQEIDQLQCVQRKLTILTDQLSHDAAHYLKSIYLCLT
jgi:hypothetical protein